MGIVKQFNVTPRYESHSSPNNNEAPKPSIIAAIIRYLVNDWGGLLWYATLLGKTSIGSGLKALISASFMKNAVEYLGVSWICLIFPISSLIFALQKGQMSSFSLSVALQ